MAKARALLSVYDKTGIAEFAAELAKLGYEIISTGGTYKHLKEAGIEVKEVSEVTGFPEALDGRVKTLHPAVHAGILARRGDKSHMDRIKELGITPVDIVVNNLYPFKQTISKDNVTLQEAIENIDIGGPSMLRAAAKNFESVTVITDPADYAPVLHELNENGDTSVETRSKLAAKAFARTAQYDALIASYLGKQAGIGMLPDILTLTYEKIQDMRYGENPHQKGAFYREPLAGKGMLTNVRQLHGKELSYNNVNDLHGALELCREFDEPTAVASKHSNPCGVGSADNICDAYMKAYTSDPTSVYGGVIVCNREIDAETAVFMSKNPSLLDIILAPSFSDEAFKILAKKKNVRLMTLAGMENKMPDGAYDFKKVSGGLLVQEADNTLLPDNWLNVVTSRKPTDKEIEDMIFAWKLVKYAKSNGIAIGKDKQSLGIGPGQVNRIWPTIQAIEHAKESLGADILKGAALASDAFFPFDDCATAAAEAGITAIIQPGGSLNDKASIDECDKFGIAMVFTGMRHFRH